LALEAANRKREDILLPLELKEIDPLIEKYITSKYQQQWNSSDCGYRRVQPTVSDRPFFLHPSRRAEVIITRLQLGRCRLNHYLHQNDQSITSLCAECGKEETIQHYILECKSELGKDVRRLCSLNNIPLLLGEVLNHPSILRLLVSRIQRKL
jgi:hypothetical protein